MFFHSLSSINSLAQVSTLGPRILVRIDKYLVGWGDDSVCQVLVTEQEGPV